jgi:antitoxin component YwqK of YwqJK toxin-antitoxin module
MPRSPFSHWLFAGSLPVTVVAMGLATTALAAERNQLRMPQDRAVLADVTSDELAYHTDLGVMGEVELVRERHPDGAVKTERQVTLDRDGNYVNHGAWKLFSAKGDVLAEGQYHFGRRVGLWTRWLTKNDSPIFNEAPFNQFKPPFMSQAQFTDGEMDGEWIITDSNDRKVNQVSLKMGQRHGTATTWLPNGKIHRQASYDLGVPTGDLLEADRKTGELKRVATFVEGRKIITRTTHYPGNRQKQAETMYLGAATTQKSGDDFWTARLAKYATDGKELRHGVAKAWYANGRTEQEGIYQFGKKSGVFTFWHENGQVAATGEYRDDQAEGTWVWWHENGQKSAFGKYQNGQLIGEWRWWNESGKLTKQHIYDGSESVSSQPESTYDVSARPAKDETSIF